MGYVRESTIEKYLVKRVKELEGRAYKFVSPGVSGVPDRLCLFPLGLFCFVECKAPGEATRPTQDLVHNAMRRMGHDVVVVDSRESVDRLISAFAARLESMRDC